tara:strand:+ start:2297 stop:2818 length:522 start_codon:yes stop_codon:yes gene_type:complete
MNIVNTLVDNIYSDNIYFNEEIENTVIEDSTFIKILYSTKDIIMNGLYIHIPLKISSTELHYKKIKYNFDVHANYNIIEKIIQLENNILTKYCSIKSLHKVKKKKSNVLPTIFNNGHIKIFPFDDYTSNNIKSKKTIHDLNISNGDFILKISGIWEKDSSFGITYKFMNVYNK